MLRIVFFGTPQFAATILGYLLDNEISIEAIVTKPDKPKGRSRVPISTPVKAIAQERIPQVPIYQPEIASEISFAEILRQHQADLFVVVAYGEIIKQHLLDMPRLGCINVHASLLPKYRGAAPIQHAIIRGESETGVTIMRLVKKMDAGAIIKAVATPIKHEMTAGELENTLRHLGSKALYEVICDFEKGAVSEIPQDESQVTLAPKIELEDCFINWESSAQSIHNLVRGVNPAPGAWCELLVRGEKKRLKIHRTSVVTGISGAPGQVLSSGKDGLIVACREDALSLLEVQLEGKKAVTGSEFIHGFPSGPLVFL